jgi:hypothetical protein
MTTENKSTGPKNEYRMTLAGAGAPSYAECI